MLSIICAQQVFSYTYRVSENPAALPKKFSLKYNKKRFAFRSGKNLSLYKRN